MEKIGTESGVIYDRSEDISVAGKSGIYGEDLRPVISVMLPTFRRPDALARTLAALEAQTLAYEYFEVVVVDDGSRDGTETLLEEFTRRTRLRFAYLVLRENGGPARARNFGLSRCRAEIVLIIGDDIEPAPNLVETHARSHERNPEITHAVLGKVSFPEGLDPSAFMRWLEKGGRKYFFNYQDLAAGEKAGPLSFYTCNVSVKMKLLEKSGWFDESFPYASHEDLELGFRLAEKGMEMIYEPQAAGYHYHRLTVEGIARRIYLMGYSAAIFWQKVGDHGGAARDALRDTICRIVSTSPGVVLWQRLKSTASDEEKNNPVQWRVLLFLSFFIGLSDSRRGKSPRV